MRDALLGADGLIFKVASSAPRGAHRKLPHPHTNHTILNSNKRAQVSDGQRPNLSANRFEIFGTHFDLRINWPPLP